MTTARELLFDAYKKAYAQRSALTGHVSLTVVPELIDTFDDQTARREMADLVSYLYGGIDPDELPLSYAIMHAEKFRDQPIWHDILKSFLKAVIAEKKETLGKEMSDAEAGEETLRNLLDELNTPAEH